MKAAVWNEFKKEFRAGLWLEFGPNLRYDTLQRGELRIFLVERGSPRIFCNKIQQIIAKLGNLEGF